MIGGLDPFEGVNPFAASREDHSGEPMSRRELVLWWLGTVLISTGATVLIAWLVLR